MELAITRSQKKSGIVSKTVVFILHVQSYLSEEEQHLVREYGLGKENIYNSEASRKHMEKAQSGGLFSMAKGIAMSALSLNISIDSLINGHSIECASLDEVLSAEEAVRDACENMKRYLDIAEKFDGTKELVVF